MSRKPTPGETPEVVDTSGPDKETPATVVDASGKTADETAEEIARLENEGGKPVDPARIPKSSKVEYLVRTDANPLFGQHLEGADFPTVSPEGTTMGADEVKAAQTAADSVGLSLIVTKEEK